MKGCQMSVKKSRKAALIHIGILLAIGFSLLALAEEKKEVPDHTNFQTCIPCHADKQKMWEESRHSQAISRIAQNTPNASACYGCHSTEGFTAKAKGEKAGDPTSFHTISCLACHDPRSSTFPRRLAMDRDKLCSACHSQRAVLEGKGAKGIEDTRSFHSGVACVSCHMTEGNHRMKVLRPDDPNLAEDRLDTCTTCHKDNNRKTRAKQLLDWQAWYKESMDPIQADLALINGSLKQNPNLLNADLKAKFNDLKANLSIIERDGSRGAHNLDYALEIMTLASGDLKGIKAAIALSGNK
jgi:predicted CXXCH cytochrome family protein